MADARILLIRHSLSQLDLSEPAKLWPLSKEGRQRAASFASTVAHYQPVKIYHSSEAKARQTAEIIATHLDCPKEQVADVQEHDRSNITEMDGDTFRRHVEGLLLDPVGYRFGGESGMAVVERFGAALTALSLRHAEETVAVTTHGTAITLFLSHHGLVQPVAYWKTLQQPALVVLRPHPWQLLATINPVWVRLAML